MLMKNNIQKIRSDNTIIESVKEGNHQAFESLYDIYASPLLGIISRITGTGKLAEDALQQAFLEIWQKIKCYDSSKDRPLVWMIKIAIKTALQIARASNMEISMETINIKNLVHNKNIEIN
jgi:DNA-directed RNA polymerase specialized sigma24 family protein